jgi:RecQ family ATP-dependent DNA helicase
MTQPIIFGDALTVSPTDKGPTLLHRWQHDAIVRMKMNVSQLVLQPTGSGKSLIYQRFASSTQQLVVVVSPLISLIHDQLHHMSSVGIVCASLCGEHNEKLTVTTTTLSTIESVRQSLTNKHQQLLLLYVTPESFQQQRVLDQQRLGLIVIDECHLMLSWRVFRPSYASLATAVRSFGVPIFALTATLIESDAAVVMKELDIATIDRASVVRPNISLNVIPKGNMDTLVSLVQRLIKKGNGIIYCLSQKSTLTISEHLRSLGFHSAAFHAGMPRDELDMIQEEYQSGSLTILVATIAYGMGINNPCIRWVIHHTLPSSLEALVQEMGRCGRDGQPADYYLMYHQRDRYTRLRLYDHEQKKVVHNLAADLHHE